MYFVTDGIIGIGFRQISGNTSIGDNQFTIGKKLPGGPKYSTIICDHYVINNCKSQFAYIAVSEVRCYALTKKFLN